MREGKKKLKGRESDKKNTKKYLMMKSFKF